MWIGKAAGGEGKKRGDGEIWAERGTGEGKEKTARPDKDGEKSKIWDWEREGNKKKGREKSEQSRAMKSFALRPPREFWSDNARERAEKIEGGRRKKKHKR